MPIQSTPTLGGSLNVNAGLVGALPYYDAGFARSVISPPIGTVVKAVDGHEYILAQASAAIASGVACVLTEPAMTMAAGAGAWTAPTITGGVPINQYAWFKKTAI
ncbi:hypothetical protein NL154_05675 [Rhizobium sp. YTUHZ044]|uniref:hypothetical protein n=1 Tax=Rhizobium sp. YTUHZ044 TaxID=2962678 RepID=UPI003DAA213D